MTATLTIRLSPKVRVRLKKRAEQEKKSESQVARDLVAQGLAQQTQWDDITDLKGCLSLPKEDNDPWRKKLRERNWRS